jgi:hypothetical protein
MRVVQPGWNRCPCCAPGDDSQYLAIRNVLTDAGVLSREAQAKDESRVLFEFDASQRDHGPSIAVIACVDISITATINSCRKGKAERSQTFNKGEERSKMGDDCWSRVAASSTDVQSLIEQTDTQG